MNNLDQGISASRLLLLFMLFLNAEPSKAQLSPPASFPLEDCFNGLDDDGDGYVDCFDLDCQCFDPPACSTTIPPNTGISMQLAWNSQASTYYGVVSGIGMVGNLNPQTDNIPEILAVQVSTTLNPANIRFFRGDGSNANASDSLILVTGANAHTDPLIGDVDGDGVPELIVAEWDSYIRVYRNFTPGADPVMSHWITASNKTQSSASRPMLADMDGDGTPEIVVDNEVFIFDFDDPANAKLRRVLDAGNNNPSGMTPHFLASPAVADLLTPADCNGDPDCDGLEIAAGPVIYSIDLDTMDGDGYQIKIQRDLNVLELPDGFSDGYTAVADMNIDGTPDVVVIGTGKVGLDPAQLGVYVWNKNGLLRFMKMPVQAFDWYHYASIPMIANVFDDTKRGLAKDFPEIVIATLSDLYCFNLHATNFPDLSAWWFLPLENEIWGFDGTATAFDFNGDGFSEIVFCDNEHLRIIYGGHLPFPPGVDADRNWASTPFLQSAGFLRYPVVADVDNDGQAEIIQMGNVIIDPPSNYFVHVYESAGLPWPSCRNLWNQFNYNIVNVDDDLGIPLQPQQHWKEFPAPGSSKRPLNMALGQRGPLNGAALIPLADLGSGVDTFYCDKDSLRLRLRVCNNGSASAPAGLSLQWYQGNPTAASAAPMGAPYIFPSVIAKDSCAFWNLALPLPPNGALYGIINDNGSLSGPIDLATDFPSTSLLECDYLDNLFFINVSYTSPTLDLGPDQSVCNEAGTLLTASPGFSRYRWQDGSENATFSATGIGTYWVDAWDICGNLFSDTLRLLAIPTPPLALGPDRSVCLGDSITLAAAGFDNVDWTTSAGNPVCAACPSFTLNPAADLTIHVTGQSGVCVERDTISIAVLPLPQIDGQALETHCGNADGSINILVNSALPYQIQWSGGQTVPALSGLAAATYTVTVTDDAGCSQSETYPVAGSAAVVLNPAVLTHPLCFGAQTGAISAGLNSGTAPYQFNWSTGPGNDVLNGLSAGNYTLTVTDGLGCTATSIYQLTEPPQLIVQSNVNGTSCVNTTADISLTPLGGTSPYLFAWDGGQNTPTLNNLSPGAYTVSVTDANGCETAQVFDIQTGGSPVLSNAVLNPVLCFGENTGAISVDATLGVSPYQFNWSTGPGTNALHNLAAGNYDLTVTGANGCTASGQYSVTEPPLLQLLSTLDSTSCTSTTADISVVPQGGTSPYSFTWNGGQNTPVLNDVTPGVYTLSVGDANGCQTTQIFDIQAGGSPVISDSLLLPVRCYGENTGEISVTATLGLPPYQFNWSTGPGAGSLNNLAAGNYSVTATDANGCSATAQFSLGQPNAISLLADIDSTSCTSSTGDISVSGQGGTAPFAYSWSGGQITPAVNNLNPGIYTVTISDANGCTLQQAFTLAPGGAPVLADSEVLPVTCPGENNGQITVDVNGGVPPYQFQWSTGSIAGLVGNLPAGDYTFTATGANGCITTVQFSVTEPALLALSATVDSTSCTSSTGNISVAPQGGTSPYTFLWSGGQNTTALSDLPPGDYSVTTTDSNGCTTSDAYTILPGGAPELAGSAVTPVTCFGENNGEISVQITGGSGSYQFNWSTGAGNNLMSDLPAGTYQLTISDANACTAVTTFTVETPAAIDAVLTTVSDTCGQFTGSISVNMSGGIALYGFLWSDGQITEDRTNISAGTFQLTVTDANGCTFTEDTEVFSVDILPLFSVAGDTITCVQPTVELTPNPAPANWSFEWQAPDGALLSGANQTFHQPGQYTVTALSELGCTTMQFIDIKIDTLTPQAMAAASDLFIPCGQSTVALDGAGSSTGAFFAAQWYRENNGQVVWDTMTPVAQAGTAGTFILQITDLLNGCTDYDTVQVTVAQPISDVAIALDSISCFGLEDGAIRVESVSGGLAPYTYALDNQAFSPVFTFTGLTEGSYTLFVQDAGGCAWQSAVLSIGEPAPFSLNLTASDTRIDQGEAVVLQAQVQPPGAILSGIQWSPQAYFPLSASLTETVQPTETTLFQIEVENANGCSASDTARVRVRREAIYVPNIFQPGIPGNDLFTVFAGADILEVQLLRVYDRWGEQLFENRHFPPNDPGQGWDGTYRGKPVGPGVYIYYVVVEMVDGQEVELKGSVTIVR